MEQKTAKKRLKIGENGKNWLLLSLAISFMVCIFAPLETYFANKTEFWFEIKQILPIILVAFVVVCIVLCLIGMLFQKTKWSHYIYGFVFCGMLYFYIQGNYVPRNYGVLNGVDIEWGSYTGYAITSIVLILFALVASAFICFKVKEKIYSVGRLVCTILILIQLVTISTLVLQSVTSDKEDVNNMVVTTKDMLNLSEEKNVIVFILDSFDSFVMQDMLAGEQGEEYKDLFRNFVYYPDTVGGYPTTKGALPQILTGKWYENDKPYTDYVREAYINNPIYNSLEENDYSVGVYTDAGYLNPKYEMYTNVEGGDYEIASYSSFAKKLYKLVAFNYMPHQLKQYFYTTSSEFDTVRKTSVAHSGYSYDVHNFYNILQKNGLSVTDEKNSFRVYHLEGIHAPYTFGESLDSQSNVNYEVYDEAAGNFTILKMYFDKLKDLDIYDKSTIVIMADHGYTELGQNPLFMVKNTDDNHKFVISDVGMTYDYLDDIFISLAKGEKASETYIGELSENGGQRRFIHYSWDNSWDRQYLPNMVEYIVVGNPNDYSNFSATGKVFTSRENAEKYQYKLGTTLFFGEKQTANAHCLYGFLGGGNSYTWSVGENAAMLFYTDPNFEMLKITLDYDVYAGKQRVIVYMNGNKVDDYTAQGPEEKTIFIPKECASGKELLLEFEFPDAISPKERGESHDVNKLALAMKSLSIKAVKVDSYAEIETNTEKENIIYELSFKKENTAGKYIVKGFSDNENDFTWTNGNIAEILLNVQETNSDLQLIMEYGVYTGKQRVIVSVNENMVEDYIAASEETKSFIIPAEYVLDGVLRLTFELPDAVSPQSRGEGNDMRRLGLAMKTLKLSAIDE